MAQAKFSFFQQGLTGYLRVIPKKASNELIDLGYQQFPPVLPTSINIEFDNLDPDVYKFYFYNSPDGVSNGLLIAVFTIDVKTNIIVSEIRFYRGGGNEATDPEAGTTIVDAYLDGKTIKKVFKEGFRFLIPDLEYETIAGGGIELLAGLDLADDEVISVEIDYLVAQVNNTTSGMFAGVATIVNSVTLDSTYLNYRLNCESGSTRLVITLPLLSTIPDGKFFYFSMQGGTQYKTRFLAGGTELIKRAGEDLPEVSIGKGEIAWIEKRGSRWEIISECPGMAQVGEMFSAMYAGHPNTIPKDGRLIDGDDEPRLYWWITNKLPISSRITVAESVLTAAYTHPVGKEGLYVLSVDTKKFRMPNTEGWAERGLKSFTTFGGDGNRTYDYPGGTQPQSIQTHDHIMHGKGPLTGNRYLTDENNRYSKGDGVDLIGGKVGSPDSSLRTGDYEVPAGVANETTGKNTGVIHLVRS